MPFRRPLRVPFGRSGARPCDACEVQAQARAREAANAFARSDEGRALLRLRGPTIERVFGQFKGNQGFRRLLLRGLSGASLELGLMSLGHNLKRLLQGPRTA